MKNIVEQVCSFYNGHRKKLIVMRNAVLMLLISAFQVVATGSYSQTAQLSLNLKNATVKEVLTAIENQSEFYFLYNSELIDVTRRVEIEAKGEKVNEVLTRLFDKNDVDFLIKDRYIVLTPVGGNAKLFDQQKTVSGVVTDNRNQPLPGVSVVIKGTTQGTVTNADGNYSISNIPENAVLQFSFVGMKSQEVAVAGKSTVNVRMEEETVGIEEVVAIGYGTQKKIDLTGSVATINFDNRAVTSRPLTNVASALVGNVPGMLVSQGSGDPASDGSVFRIRGIGTLNAGADPLIIIDGQPGDINSVNPNDVASVSVLKDAASGAIYGSRASNGVILITTKTGKNTGGKISVDYNGNIGFASPTKLFDFITNTADHMEVINRMEEYSDLDPEYPQEWIDEWREKSKTDPLRYPNTNWWDATLKQNAVQTHTISVRGGNDRISFFTSLGNINNNGLVDKTGYNRYTLRNNMSYKVNEWLNLGSNITGFLGKAGPVDADDLFYGFYSLTPGLTPKSPDGRYGDAMTNGSENQAGADNPIKKIGDALGERYTQEYSGKLFAVLNPLKGLEINASYFVNMYNYNSWNSGTLSNTWNFQTEEIVRDFVSTGRLPISNSYIKKQREVVDLFGTYSLTAGNHNFKFLAGYNQEYFKQSMFSATNMDLISNLIPVLDAAPTLYKTSGTATDFAVKSVFGRVNYNFREKYLLETNLRYDGSSRFAPGRQWGLFPSVSAAWRISEEPFWNNISDKISNLKLRASYGQLGNNSISNYAWQSVYNANNTVLNGIIVQGLAPNAIANPFISWETTDVVNAGFDINFLKHFTLSLEYYDKLTHGILARIPVPFVNGGLENPLENSAKVRNSGAEGVIGYNTTIGGLTISASVNGTFNKNRIVKYKGDYLEPHGTANVWTEGKPIGIFWLREVDHIIQSQDEVDELENAGMSFDQTPGPGDFLYRNANGDMVIDDDDRILKGNPIPLFHYGGDLNISFKNFDFYSSFYGVSGWDKYDDGFDNLSASVGGCLYPKTFLKMWTPENKSTKVPKVYTDEITQNSLPSDYYLHDASFLRIKCIQLGYTVPATVSRKFKIDKIRVYLNLENYFLFTKYPGMDPELTGVEESSSISYPMLKTASAGINITL